MAKPKFPFSRRFKIRLALSCLLFLVGLVVLDIALDKRRAVYPDYHYVPDYDIVVNRPGLRRIVQAKRVDRSTQKLVRYSYSVTIDDDGSRTEENPAPYRPDTAGLAVVGDSFSFGMHSPYEATFAGLLQAHFPDCKVFDFGVPATCSRDFPLTLDYFLKKKAPFKLKAVLVSLFTDDGEGDLPRALARKLYGTYREIGGYYIGPSNYQLISPSPLRRALFQTEMFLHSQSSLFNLLVPRKPPPEYCEEIVPPLSEGKAQEIVDLELGHLEKLREVSGLPASSIVVQLICSLPDTEALVRAYNQGTPYPAPWNWALWDRIRDEISRRGYVVVDNRLTMARKAVDPAYVADRTRPIPLAWDGHYTDTGFEWLSQPLMAPMERILSR